MSDLYFAAAAPSPALARNTDLRLNADPFSAREGDGVDNGTDGTHGPASAPLSAAQAPSELRLIDSPDGLFAGREGEGSTPSTTTTLSWERDHATQTQERY